MTKEGGPEWVVIQQKLDGSYVVVVGTVRLDCPTERDAWVVKEAIDQHISAVG